NTTYIEESQPMQDVTIRLESGETLSTSCCHGETDADHFLSASLTGRRVSFNEAAIYEQSAKDQEKGRRYTLTEGDFHHLKKARLTHMQPPALKILTIMECDSPENSVTLSEQPSQHPSLSIFQKTLKISLLMDRDSTSCAAQGTMFHFLSKLRRHASLEGAGPFWRLDSIQRAASLDTRGSPRRRAFQRQRAASETLDHVEETLQGGVSDFFLQKPTALPQKEPPRRLSEMMAEASGGDGEEYGPVSRQESLEQPSLYRDIWSLRASLEQYASSDLSSNDRDSTRSDADSVCSAGQGRNGRDSVDSERGSDGETNNRKLLQMDSGYFRLFGSSSGKTASERQTPITGEPQPLTKPRPHFRRRDYSIDEKTEALFNEFLRHDPQFDQQGSPSLRHRHRSRIHLRKQWQRSKQYSDPGAARYSPSLERQRCYPLRRGDSANYPLDTRYYSTLPRIASAADEEASEGAASTESPEPEKSGPELEGADPSSETRSSGPDLEENANNSSNNTSRHFFSSQTQDNSARDCGILEDLGTNAHSTDSHKHSQMDRGGPMATYSSHLHSHTNTLMLDPTDPDQDSRHTLTDISPSDKLASTLDDRLYSNLRTQRGSQECVVTVSRTSPDLEE
uniref:Voltage-dependent calcium channel beta subunit-associated regulatory protein-like n=1 Tax=Sinocyclocheilus rhinocerous TaxID=307959 RepID=A0A673HBW9_9TELE